MLTKIFNVPVVGLLLIDLEQSNASPSMSNKSYLFTTDVVIIIINNYFHALRTDRACALLKSADIERGQDLRPSINHLNQGEAVYLPTSPRRQYKT